MAIEPKPASHRIVVAFDSMAAAHALEAATELAARLQAELEGLFVEDENLMRIAELNLGRVYDALSGRHESATSAAMAQMVRGEAARIRQAMAAQAARAHVAHRFRIVRGMLERELATAAQAADLLVLSLSSRAVGARVRADIAWITAVEHALKPVLVIRPGARLGGRAMVLYDDPARGAALLAAASQLVTGADGMVTVLLVAADERTAAALRAAAEADLARLGLAGAFRQVAAFALDDVCALLGAADAGVFVIRAEHPALAGPGIAALLERVSCPVLVVR
ncbi:MAG: hypothetical protein AB7K86_05665 [Rhodospirillales bacterium]